MPLGKFFFIQSKTTDLVLEVEGDGKDPGTRVIMLPRKDGLPQDQLWWEDHITGCIRSDLLPELCLSINAETQKLCIDIFSVEDPLKHWITSGERIQCRSDQSKLLEIEGASKEEGTELCTGEPIFVPENDDPEPSMHQRWNFIFQEARLFKIHSELNGKVLGYETFKLRMQDYKALPTQHWYEDKHGMLYNANKGLCINSEKGYGKSLSLEHFESGEMNLMWIRSGNKIINQAQPSHLIAIKNKDMSEGAKVIVREYKGNPNQHWRFQYLKDEPQ